MAIADHIKKDSPTNNFATLNSLNLNSSHNNPTQGNLKITGHTGGFYYGGILSSIHADISDSNLYYAEFAMLNSFNSTGYFQLAVATDNYQPTNTGAQSKPHVNSNGIGFGASGTNIVSNNTNVFSITTSFSAPDTSGIWQILFKASTGEVWFGKNGTLLNSGSSVASISGDYKNLNFCVEVYTQSDTWVVNFGQDSTFGGNKTSGSAYAPDASGIGDFYYTPPSGAKALCTANLPDFTPNVADDNPEDFFKCVSWTGNSTDNRQITIGFQPDLIWNKRRNVASTDNQLHDSVRGITKVLRSNTTGAENTESTAVKTVNSTGFTIGTDNNINNPNTTNYVAWCFRAGGSPSGATSATGSAKRINSSGTQDHTSCEAIRNDALGGSSNPSEDTANHMYTPSAMSINQQSGFSILTYQGHGTNTYRRIPHGLNKKPDFAIFKQLTDSGYSWRVYHKSIGATHSLILDSAAAAADRIYDWNDTEPTNKYFTVNNDGALQLDGKNFVAYIWTEIPGYSLFSSYVGNGSATAGPFIATGFKPAWVLVKRTTDGTNSWEIRDNARDTFNSADNRLFPDSSLAEDPDNEGIDFLSNGFRIMNSGGGCNTDEKTYVFAAFAEIPQKYAVAR